MELFIIVSLGILGLIVGSFLNVVTLRARTSETIGGRSHCMYCSYQLRWYDLIPALSYLFLKGRCRSCRHSISPQYIIVEVLLGIIFALIACFFIEVLSVSVFHFIVNISMWYIITALSLSIIVYDIRHMIVPNEWVYPLIGISFLSLFFMHHGVWGAIAPPDLMMLIAGPLVALPFAALWYLSKGRLFGFGDVKIMLAMGWMLGSFYGALAIMISFWIAGLWVLLLWIASRLSLYSFPKQSIMKIALPFAPFLIIGWYGMFFFGSHIHYALFPIL